MSHLITAKSDIYNAGESVCCGEYMFNTANAESSVTISSVTDNGDGSYSFTLTKANIGNSFDGYVCAFYLCCAEWLTLEVGDPPENWVATLAGWLDLLLYSSGDYDSRSDPPYGGQDTSSIIPITACGLLVEIYWNDIAAEVGETIVVTYGS